MGIVLSGEWHGDKMAGRVQAAGRRATRAAAERLRALALPRTPLDQGPLRASAKVRNVNAEAVALVTYDSIYAVYQHEGVSFNHSVGEAKFLERPLTENKGQLLTIMAEVMRNELTD